MQNKLQVVGIQTNLIWENPKENRKCLENKINTLVNSVDLIVLPEMFTSGFTMNATKVAEKMNGKSVLWMQKIAKEKNTAVVGSLIILEGLNFYNRLLFVHPTGEIEKYDKKHLFTLAGEDKVYTAGSKKLIVNYKGWKICPLTCYDLRFPVWARNIENYDLLLYVANWPTPRINAWTTLLKARAVENMSFVIGINRVGKDGNGYSYSGNSIIVDYLGNEITNFENNEEGIIATTLNKENQNKVRAKYGFLKDKDSFTVY